MVFSLVSSVKASCSDGGNNVTSAAINTSGANLIVVHVATYQDATGTLSDSKGNTWSGLTATIQNSYATSKLYYCYSPATDATHTFTFSSSARYPSIQVAAFSGSASSPFDVENGAGKSTYGSSSTLSTGSITPSVDNELVVTGCCGPVNGSDITSIDGGFTFLLDSAHVPGQAVAGSLAYLIQTTAASANPAWSITGGNDYAARIASFKSSGAAGPTTGRLASFYAQFQVG